MGNLDVECRDINDRRKKVVSKEKSRSHIGLNPQSKLIQRYKVDGCLLDVSQSKCDYLLLVDETAYYIELKGSDREKGCHQLLETIHVLQRRIQKETTEARLVVSRSPKPKVPGLNERRLRVLLKKLNGAGEYLRIQSQSMTEDL